VALLKRRGQGHTRPLPVELVARLMAAAGSAQAEKAGTTQSECTAHHSRSRPYSASIKPMAPRSGFSHGRGSSGQPSVQVLQRRCSGSPIASCPHAGTTRGRASDLLRCESSAHQAVAGDPGVHVARLAVDLSDHVVPSLARRDCHQSQARARSAIHPDHSRDRVTDPRRPIADRERHPELRR
jgi:hypothetical protein